MIGEFKFDGSIQNILVVTLIIALGIYVYLGFRTIRNEINDLRLQLSQKSSFQDPSLAGPSLAGPSLAGPSLAGPSLFSTEYNTVSDNGEEEFSNIPEIPYRPEKPEIPYRPEIPEIPEIPYRPEIPEIPYRPEIPEIPYRPEISEIPYRPEKPEIPETDIGDTHCISELQKLMESEEDIIEDINPTDDIRLISADSTESKYSAMTVSELKAILTDRNLPLSGNKTKLIKRIQENMVISKVDNSSLEQINISG